MRTMIQNIHCVNSAGGDKNVAASLLKYNQGIAFAWYVCTRYIAADIVFKLRVLVINIVGDRINKSSVNN